MNDHLAIRIDDTRNASEWWQTLFSRYPEFAISLARNGIAVVQRRHWETLAGVPGWAGPEGQETPVIAVPGFVLEGRKYDTFEVLR